MCVTSGTCVRKCVVGRGLCVESSVAQSMVGQIDTMTLTSGIGEMVAAEEMARRLRYERTDGQRMVGP